MTLIGNRPECRVSSVECRASAAAHASRFTLLAPRFTLHLSCLTLPVLLLLSASPSLSLAASSTPYQSIVERNVFGLKPPPPPPDPETLKPPPPKLTLTGIMTIFGKKQALFKSPPTPAPPAKPGQQPEPPKEHSYILAEGQREDGITVLQIDDVAKTVKLDADGTIVNLTFSTNNTSTASAPGPGGIPSPTGMGGPNPAFQPGGPRTIPRPLRIPGMGAAPGNASGASVTPTSYGNTAVSSSGSYQPPMNYGGMPMAYGASAVQQPSAMHDQQPDIPPDQQAALMLLNHTANKNNPNYPPPPPPIAELMGEPNSSTPAAPAHNSSGNTIPRVPGMPMAPPPLPQ